MYNSGFSSIIQIVNHFNFVYRSGLSNDRSLFFEFFSESRTCLIIVTFVKAGLTLLVSFLLRILELLM